MIAANCAFPVAIAGLFAVGFWLDRQDQQRRKAISNACFGFDLTLAARRYRDKTGCNEEEALRVEREFRRFFLLIAENPGKQFGLHNGQIDDFWHELICCTALYHDFCIAVAGRFIHHDPQGGRGDGYAGTWWAYHDRFAEAPALAYWPTPDPPARPLGGGGSSDGGCGGSSCGGGGGCCGGCGGGCGGG